MGAIVIRTRYDEGTESAEVATSGVEMKHKYILLHNLISYRKCKCAFPAISLHFKDNLQHLLSNNLFMGMIVGGRSQDKNIRLYAIYFLLFGFDSMNNNESNIKLKKIRLSMLNVVAVEP